MCVIHPRGSFGLSFDRFVARFLGVHGVGPLMGKRVELILWRP